MLTLSQPTESVLEFAGRSIDSPRVAHRYNKQQLHHQRQKHQQRQQHKNRYSPRPVRNGKEPLKLCCFSLMTPYIPKKKYFKLEL